MNAKSILLLACLAFCFTHEVKAQVPRTLPVQGQLFQNDGQPVSDGEHEISVALFDVAQGGEGTILCDACRVTFTHGVFQVVLGKPGSPPIPRLSDPSFLEITVDGEILSPRIQLESVAFAHEAAHAMQANNGVPVGAIIAMAGAPAPGGDYIVADGRDMSSGEYPELYRVIGTTWGAGGTSGTDDTDFNLPDLRGIFLRGDDLGSGRDGNAAERVAHTFRENDSSTVGTYQDIDNIKFTAEMGQIHASRTLQASGPSGTSHYTQPTTVTVGTRVPNAAVVYVIKVR